MLDFYINTLFDYVHVLPKYFQNISCKGTHIDSMIFLWACIQYMLNVHLWKTFPFVFCIPAQLTLTVLVTTIDALQHFETG